MKKRGNMQYFFPEDETYFQNTEFVNCNVTQSSLQFQHGFGIGDAILFSSYIKNKCFLNPTIKFFHYSKNLYEFNKKLYIYRCDKINFQNLKSVKSNPVINKFYSSRNAGSIYKKNKLFFRPAQINRKNIYGYGFTLNKIINS